MMFLVWSVDNYPSKRIWVELLRRWSWRMRSCRCGSATRDRRIWRSRRLPRRLCLLKESSTFLWLIINWYVICLTIVCCWNYTCILFLYNQWALASNDPSEQFTRNGGLQPRGEDLVLLLLGFIRMGEKIMICIVKREIFHMNRRIE